MRKKNKINGNTKVFVCDDEPGLINAIKVMLGREGFLVEGSTIVQEAMYRLLTEDFDIVFVNYYLNGLSGDKLIKVLRDNRKSIFTVLMSVDPAVDSISASDLIAQADCYLMKSHSFDKLISIVKNMQYKKRVGVLFDNNSSMNGLNGEEDIASANLEIEIKGEKERKVKVGKRITRFKGTSKLVKDLDDLVKYIKNV